MTNSQSNFITKVKDLLAAFNSPTLNNDANNDEHNRVAKLLRNGMAVILFLTVEDFIKGRSKEILNEISQSNLSFSELPEKIQYATTANSLSAINRIFQYEDTRYDKMTFVQNQVKDISSTLTANYNLSPYAYGHKKTNIEADEVGTVLKSFYVVDPWGAIDRVANRLGLSALPLKNSFINGSKRRNSAAHDANANVPITDLIQFGKDILSIGVGFDSLLTYAAKRIIDRNVIIVNNKKQFKDSDLKISKVIKVGRKWKYFREGNLRSSKNDTTILGIDNFAINDSNSRNEPLVMFDESRIIRGWEF